MDKTQSETMTETAFKMALEKGYIDDKGYILGEMPMGEFEALASRNMICKSNGRCRLRSPTSFEKSGGKAEYSVEIPVPEVDETSIAILPEEKVVQIAEACLESYFGFNAPDNGIGLDAMLGDNLSFDFAGMHLSIPFRSLLIACGKDISEYNGTIKNIVSLATPTVKFENAHRDALAQFKEQARDLRPEEVGIFEADTEFGTISIKISFI